MISSLLFILLVVLKVTGVIDWSWWWVTAPLWYFPALMLWMALLGGLGTAAQKGTGWPKDDD